MIRGFFYKFNRSSKNLKNVIFHVKLLSPTLKVNFSLQAITLYCRNTRIVGWNKTFWDRQPSTSLPDCLTALLLFVFTWWEDFLKISRKWEAEGFGFRLNGWQQCCARNYERKCNAFHAMHYNNIFSCFFRTWDRESFCWVRTWNYLNEIFFPYRIQNLTKSVALGTDHLILGGDRIFAKKKK